LNDRLATEDVVKRAEDAVAAIRTQFPAVKPPPKFDPNAPPPEAATRPTTGPRGTTQPAAPPRSAAPARR
jgi:hypothetical protein